VLDCQSPYNQQIMGAFFIDKQLKSKAN